MYDMNILKINEWVEVNKPEYVTTTTDNARTNKQKGRYYVYELNGRYKTKREFFVYDHETQNVEIHKYGGLVKVFDTFDEMMDFFKSEGCKFNMHDLPVCFSKVFYDEVGEYFGLDEYGYPKYYCFFIDDTDKLINFLLS